MQKSQLSTPLHFRQLKPSLLAKYPLWHCEQVPSTAHLSQSPILSEQDMHTLLTRNLSISQASHVTLDKVGSSEVQEAQFETRSLHLTHYAPLLFLKVPF